MKKIIFFLLFFVQFGYSQTEWFASPMGTPTGDGSITNPWDLQTALNNTTDIQPGHTLWLRDGIYTGQFDSFLQGTASQPITVQSYPGEKAILNGNTVSYTPGPIVPNPNPPLVNPNKGIYNRVKKFYWSLDPEGQADFYDRALLNPNLNQNGLKLINLPKPAVLNPQGGYVHYKNFEITCLGSFERELTLPNFFRLDGIYLHNSLAVGNKFIELVIYNNSGTGISSWKNSGEQEFNGCLIYNNGWTDLTTIRGHGPAFYVQNQTDDVKLFKNNAVFNNYSGGFEIWSAAQNTTIPDYVKNVDLIGNTVFKGGGAFSNWNFATNVILATDWSNPSTPANVARNMNVFDNSLYHSTDYSFTGTSGFGTSLVLGWNSNAPIENINISNNFISGINDAIRFNFATNSLIFNNNIHWGRYVYHQPDNTINCDISNWTFNNNTYYTRFANAFRQYGAPFIDRNIVQWQTDFSIDPSSTRLITSSFQEYTKVRAFDYSNNKYLVTLVRRNGQNVALDIASQVSGFSIPIGTPYRIIDTENYHAEASLPFSNIYSGTPVIFNMQSAAYEMPQNNIVSVKTPTNFGCFIIEFDLCTNTTAQLNLPNQTCVDTGSLTNLAQYVSSAPNTGVFSGIGIQQIGSEYIFDAAVAGVGTHSITYTFQNNTGCPFTTITSSITVVDNCLQKPYLSQTYFNNTDKFIEVKNSSDTQTINAGNYYLALYENNEATNVAPTKFINLGTIAPQGVSVFKATTGGNLGYVTATDWSALDSYDGVDDIVILTTTIDANAYANRLDEFGASSFNAFDDNITLQQQASFVRMSCAPAMPTPIYNQEHWVYFKDTEVANSISLTNAELGRHFDKPLIWEVTNTWNEFDIPNSSPAINESYPDRSRFVSFTNDYCTGINTTSCLTGYGSFEACGILLTTGIILTINPSTYIKVFTSIDATAAGSNLIVENQGSLIMVYDCYNGNCGIDLIDLGTMATMQADKQTVGINGPYDYVYWSSPLSTAITNPTINQVFTFGSTTGLFNPNRFYLFENSLFYDEAATYGNNGSGTDGYDDDFNDYNPLNTLAEQTAQFIPGRGYATWPPINDTDGYAISFSGEMNNGEVTVAVYRNNSVNGGNPNLVGNPYPSAIDLDILFAENSTLIEPLAFVWGRAIIDDPNNTNTGPNQLNYQEDNYQIYNPTMIIDPVFNGNIPFNSEGILASCQSFFVRTKDPVGGYTVTNTGLIEQAGDLVFKNKMRTTAANTTFARLNNAKNTVLLTETHNDKLWVNLTDNEGYTAQLGLAFLQNATTDYLIGEDVKTVNGRKYNFYTKSTNEDLIIDVQDAFNENKVIPLGITNTSENAQMMFTISIPKKEGVFNTQNVYLHDALLNIYHNLTNGAYTFTTNSAIIDNRFNLVFTTNPITFTKQVDTNEVIVFIDQNTVKIISSKKNITSVEVFDIYTANTSGMLIGKSGKVNEKEVTIPVGEVLFINVKIRLEDGTLITKKIRK